MKKVGCFISSHGFGHATRSCAILEALNRYAEFDIHIFTSVDESIFAQSLYRYSYHNLRVDVGFAQNDAFHIDIDATITQLEALLPHSQSLVNSLAKTCRDYSFIICDISVLGIAVATQAQIPSVLIENFTWDWLYKTYTDLHPKLSYYSEYLADLYHRADYHIQTEPVCKPYQADLLCGPIFRTIRQDPKIIKESFHCGSRKVVLITLGGNRFSPQFLSNLKIYRDYFFILCGQEKEDRPYENVQLLDQFPTYYHPDLINCADITVFKCGYSTLAECYQAGKSSICITRDGFAESDILESYARESMPLTVISQTDFISGEWFDMLSQIEIIAQKEKVTDGADKVAEFLLHLL